MAAEKHTDDYARQDVNETLAGLEVDAARGLSDAAVRQRLTRYGYEEDAGGLPAGADRLQRSRAASDSVTIKQAHGSLRRPSLVPADTSPQAPAP